MERTFILNHQRPCHDPGDPHPLSVTRGHPLWKLGTDDREPPKWGVKCRHSSSHKRGQTRITPLVPFDLPLLVAFCSFVLLMAAVATGPVFSSLSPDVYILSFIIIIIIIWFFCYYCWGFFLPAVDIIVWRCQEGALYLSTIGILDSFTHSVRFPQVVANSNNRNWHFAIFRIMLL